MSLLISEVSPKMAEKYKLTYFDARGRAEAIRLIFAYGKVPYEDNRFPDAEWESLKQKTPWGQVPILEVNGKVVAQSHAIVRYLSKKLNLYGSDDFDAAKIDEYADAVEDLRSEWRKLFFEKDPEKKAELKATLMSTHLPNYLERFSKIILKADGGPYLLGEKLSFADILLANQLDSFECTIDEDILNEYPAMKEYKEAVLELPNIKEHIAKRPPAWV